MKLIISECIRKSKEFHDIASKYDAAMTALAGLEFENKQETILELRKRKEEASIKSSKFENAVTALQQACEHKSYDGVSEFKYIGVDVHGQEYERCNCCGLERIRNNVDLKKMR